MREENWKTDRSEDRIVTDYIDRELAIKEVVVNSVKHRADPDVATDMIRGIERLPAADVRPVVLCKDCLHEDCAMYHGPNWFCADGEKREES